MTNRRTGVYARRTRIVLALFAVLTPLLSAACSTGPDTEPGAVHVLTTDGVVNPVMERYLDRGISKAQDEEAAAVVIRMDTPGGLVSSMDDIIDRILRAEVPVVVYVWPPGSHAASAGTYITYASHVAVMAPTTRIGAATPISGTGEDLEGDLRNKVVNDSVTKIRELAELRGRNADWGEDAVRRGITAGASSAIDLNIVEYIATDLDDLLAQIDGQEVVLQNGEEQVLRTADADVAFNDTTFVEDFLDVLADPNIAFLLLSLGSLALFIEIIHPGAIFPGVFGVISLLMAFFALSVIPFNWAGVALIMFAFVLFGLEIFVTSHGVLGLGGAVALVLGGSLLTSGNPDGFQVSPWVVWGVAAVLGGMVVFIFVNVLSIRRKPAQIGLETIVGRHAVARSPIDPHGFVFMDGEYWRAEADDDSIPAGERVVVTELKGLKLKVKRER
jgi:membrane-bound serine protease (ClpP class)